MGRAGRPEGLGIWGSGIQSWPPPFFWRGRRGRQYQIKTLLALLGLGAVAQLRDVAPPGNIAGLYPFLLQVAVRCPNLQNALFATVPDHTPKSLFPPLLCYAPLHFSPPASAPPHHCGRSENLLVPISAHSSPPQGPWVNKVWCPLPRKASTSPNGLRHPFPIVSAAPFPPPGCPGVNRLVPVAPSISSHPR